MMNAAQQYMDLFRQEEQAVRSHAPEGMNGLREQAFADLGQAGFPTPEHEDFKYTDVARLFAPDYGLNLHRRPAPPPPPSAVTTAEEMFRCNVPDMRTHLFFVVNDAFYEDSAASQALPAGVYAGGMSRFMTQHPDVAARYYGRIAPTSDDAVTALNTLFAQDGFVLYVPQNVRLERTVQLVNLFRGGGGAVMANRRILVILEPRSEARLLVCDHSPEGVKCLSTQVVEIFAHEGAFFDYYDLEESTASTTRYSSLHVRQEKQSNVLVNGITLNNGVTRNNYSVDLDGEQAEITLCGMAVQDKHQQVDTFTRITHAAPRCKSTELFKNVLDEQAVGIFSGRILVREGADRTEAFQTNRNMCLTRTARMYSKPQLEIYADDVRCSHGMTTGQLDDQMLFYMQSRGISRPEARTLLSIAFTSDVIENVRLTPLKERLHYLTDKRFRGELIQCSACNSCR
jgi:Fe-S cluster assembly protein SufD